MADRQERPIEDRLVALFASLGVERAHIVACTSWDWAGLVASHPELIASLTLVNPGGLDVGLLRPIASRLLVIGGEGGGDGDTATPVAQSDALPGTVGRRLAGYAGLAWSDPASDQTDALARLIRSHVDRHSEGVEPARSGERHGEVADIKYQTVGSGPPVVFLPLMLAPSQWTPLVPSLSDGYAVITLGGQELGFVPLLEDRGCTPGYRRLVGGMLNAVGLGFHHDVLEVGCGPGSLLRWLVGSKKVARIVGADINEYLLGEARDQASREGMGACIDVRHGNAEDLPFPDERFDVTFSSTVMEEVDADLMLAEMIRVTRPGGKVVVIVRAVDVPWVVDAGLPPALRERVEAAGGGVAEKGCADASLYRRFRDAGLRDTHLGPQFLPLQSTHGRGVLLRRVLEGMASGLEQDDASVFTRTVATARDNGALLVAWPHHCAGGTKPTSA